MSARHLVLVASHEFSLAGAYLYPMVEVDHSVSANETKDDC